jgi:tRNA-dihydrouridine synthase 1
MSEVKSPTPVSSGKMNFVLPPYNPPKKLPYDFWREMGSPRTVVAPMVDNSDLAFRMQTRKYGAEITFTQMLNASIFSNSKDIRKKLFTGCPEDRPLFAQIAGHEPQLMLASAKYLENECDAVDINLGCPQGIAKRGKYGAFLMEELELLDSIVRTLVTGLNIPVTCKTRIYKDFETSIRLCETLVNAGASVLTIHGRTREEKGHYVKEADWDMIARIKKHFSEREPPIPIIANGGIENMDDVMRCLEYTKCDAVMTSEAILENPAIFTRNMDPNGNYMTQIELAGTKENICIIFLRVVFY